PLNVSPVSASFIGLMHQGIHLALSLACPLAADPPKGDRRCLGTRRAALCVPLFLYSLLSAKLK
ncbi:MAG TPA: hypothetical protein VFV38_40360, partial [Ktedonobacteraceae bacterium]|nr:hypothetical protein [Ktedonobacteraceae bacterium]